ncbi:MAG: hypothetical protein LBF65_00585 [Holosporales bacterium]|nr:hypothetical protein [Holosporales bacterium]
MKNTLIICLTILISCVLFISYNEYTNRYTLVATQDNSLYIFDKRSTVLNRCSAKGCELIETKLPSKVFFPLLPDSSPSKLFDGQKNMSDALTTAEAVKGEQTAGASRQAAWAKGEKVESPSVQNKDADDDDFVE